MRSDGSGQAFAYSVIAGCLTSEAALAGFGAWTGGFADWHWEGWVRALDVAGGVLLGIVWVSFPLTILGALMLGAIGLPITHRIGRRFSRAPMAFLSIASATIVGSIVFYALMWATMGPPDEPGETGPSTLQNFGVLIGAGALFGGPTGFWWWFFYRRLLLREDAEGEPA